MTVRSLDEWTKYATSISLYLYYFVSLVHMALSIACVSIQTNNDNRESKKEIRLYSSLKVRTPKVSMKYPINSNSESNLPTTKLFFFTRQELNIVSITYYLLFI